MPPRKPFEANRGGWCCLPPDNTSEWNTLPLRAPPSREPTLDCPADERKAWDGALCEKALCFFFSLLCFHSLCTFRAYFLLSIRTTRHLNFTGPLSFIYYITDVSQLQQRNNEKKKNLLRKWRRDTALPMTKILKQPQQRNGKKGTANNKSVRRGLAQEGTHHGRLERR